MRSWDEQATNDHVHVLVCAACPGVSTVTTAPGWEGYRIDDAAEGESSAVAFYCPECAKREFGSRPSHTD